MEEAILVELEILRLGFVMAELDIPLWLKTFRHRSQIEAFLNRLRRG